MMTTFINKTPLFDAFVKKGAILSFIVSFRDRNGHAVSKTGATVTSNYWTSKDISGAAAGSFIVNTGNIATGDFVVIIPETTPAGFYYCNFSTSIGGAPEVNFEFTLDVSTTHGKNAARELVTGGENIIINAHENTIYINHVGAVVDGGGSGNAYTGDTLYASQFTGATINDKVNAAIASITQGSPQKIIIEAADWVDAANTSAITVNKECWIVGPGEDALQKYNGASLPLNITASGNYSIIEGLGFDMVDNNNSNVDGIKFTSAKYVNLNQCQVANAVRHAIVFDGVNSGCYHNEINGGKISAFSGNGIFIYTSGSEPCNDNEIENMTINGAPGSLAGFRVESGINNTIAQSYFQGMDDNEVDQWAIVIDGGAETNINHCVIDSNVEKGIKRLSGNGTVLLTDNNASVTPLDDPTHALSVIDRDFLKRVSRYEVINVSNDNDLVDAARDNSFFRFTGANDNTLFLSQNTNDDIEDGMPAKVKNNKSVDMVVRPERDISFSYDAANEPAPNIGQILTFGNGGTAEIVTFTDTEPSGSFGASMKSGNIPDDNDTITSGTFTATVNGAVTSSGGTILGETGPDYIVVIPPGGSADICKFGDTTGQWLVAVSIDGRTKADLRDGILDPVQRSKGIKISSSTNYTLGVDTDEDYSAILRDKSTAQTNTVPDSATDILPIGIPMYFIQSGAGELTWVKAGASDVFRYPPGGGPKSPGQNAEFTILQVSLGVFQISGGIPA